MIGIASPQESVTSEHIQSFSECCMLWLLAAACALRGGQQSLLRYHSRLVSRVEGAEGLSHNALPGDVVPHMKRFAQFVLVCTLAAALAACGKQSTQAQGPPGQGGPPPAALVGFTEAREHTLHQQISLPGTVEAQTASTIAAAIPGQVVEFPAKEGMHVKHGQVLARIRSTTLELQLQAQRAALKEASARLKLADSNLARAKELFAAGVIARQQYDDAQSEFNAWQGRAESLTADVARLQDDLERTAIRSPFTGVVTRELTEVGQWLAIGGPVVEILLTEEMEIRVEVPERFFSELRDGAAASVTFESVPNLKVNGRVTAIIPRADVQARTFPVKVTVPNAGGRMGAGMLAQVSFGSAQPYRGTIVPKDAVITRGQRQIVFRIRGDKAEELDVETRAGAGQWIEVRGDIKPGDKVITRGNERILPGMAVNPSPVDYAKP
jgi:RND family efflux transporter MFP subunit